MKTPTRPNLRLIGKTPIRLIILLSLLSAFPIHLLRWEKPHQPVTFLRNRSSIREQILNNKMQNRATLRLLYRPCNQQFISGRSAHRNESHTAENVSSDTSVVFRPYGNHLRWSLYRAGITPLRGLYACYTGNLCTLVIYGNIVCTCTSYVGLR